MKTTTVAIFLLLAGITGIYIGASLLFDPIAFEAAAQIPIVADVNLLSEIRSSGGAILGTAMIIGLGAFLKQLTKISLILSVLFYLSYGVSRTIAILQDGLPGNALIYVTIAELVIGTIALLLLVRYINQEKKISF